MIQSIEVSMWHAVLARKLTNTGGKKIPETTTHVVQRLLRLPGGFFVFTRVYPGFSKRTQIGCIIQNTGDALVYEQNCIDQTK